MRTAARIVVVAALVVLTAGCSFSGSVGGKVATDDLEKQVSASLEEQIGRAPDSIECEDPLPAKVDAEVRCTLTDGGTRYGTTVVAKEVDGGDVKLAIT